MGNMLKFNYAIGAAYEPRCTRPPCGGTGDGKVDWCERMELVL